MLKHSYLKYLYISFPKLQCYVSNEILYERSINEFWVLPEKIL